jgi:formyl-CoA transferase
MENNDDLQEIVAAWVGQRPRDEVLTDLDDHEVVAAAVNDAKDIVEDPHFRERTLVDLAGTVLGKALVPGPVLHMGSYAGPVYDGVPTIGEHTATALPELLGMAADELEALGAAAVVGPTPVHAT